MELDVIKGDITKFDGDIIVNAANKTLLGGGGVDGAIHRKAGKELLEECRKLHGCETGEAKITNAYNLPCKRIIHTVGPVYSKSKALECERLLKNAYYNSLSLAKKYKEENNLEEVSIAFPCISTGIYHYPKEEACMVAINTCKEFDDNMKVYFVCFEDADYNLYLANL